MFQSLKMEFQCLEHVSVDLEDDVSITWSAYHASKHRGLRFRPGVSALLSLLPERVNSVVTVKRDMDKMSSITVTALPLGLRYMGPVKRICVFEHSVMTNFNCACPAIQRGQGSGFLSEGSSWLTACMSGQRRFFLYLCLYAQRNKFWTVQKGFVWTCAKLLRSKPYPFHCHSVFMRNWRQTLFERSSLRQSKKISNDQELIQSDPTSCPQNQKGNN